MIDYKVENELLRSKLLTALKQVTELEDEVASCNTYIEQLETEISTLRG